ncbi:hypothetical protein DPMN_102040 [Dreissena polymorpha]|uniref:Uncharacterized protein n=1 Tax=Dreissena polymorpha TaxID=45954 RepID=A0A9D4RA88_DREPO|nr:hypothetical protein DPMN_102040 [Dreissena polymorpha]
MSLPRVKKLEDIIGTNLQTKVLTRKNAPPPSSHIIGMNLLTKFHEDRTANMASREKCPPLGSHINLLTKFHEDWTINVASRVLTRKNAPPLVAMFLKQQKKIELIQDIIGTNLQTKFHDDRKINVTSTRPWVFLPIRTIFELDRHIQKTHVLTKVHEDWTKNVTSRVFTCFHYIHIEKTAPPPGGHEFSMIWTIFEHVRDINETNLLTKFHDDWAKIVTSRVFTRNTAPPPGGHLHKDCASNVTSTVFTSFELSRGINGTYVLTKFHEDQTINVASRVFTRQNVYDGRRTTDKRRSQKLTMSTLCSGELKRGV